MLCCVVDNRPIVNGHTESAVHDEPSVESENTEQISAEPLAISVTNAASPELSATSQMPILPSTEERQSEAKEELMEISVNLTATSEPIVAEKCVVENRSNENQSTCDGERKIFVTGHEQQNVEVTLTKKSDSNDKKESDGSSLSVTPSPDLLQKLKAFFKVTNLAGTVQLDWPAEMVLMTKTVDCVPLTYSHNPLQFDYAKLYSGVARKRKNTDFRNNDSGGGKTGHKSKKKKRKAKPDNIPLGSVRVKETLTSSARDHRHHLVGDAKLLLTNDSTTGSLKGAKQKKKLHKRVKAKKASVEKTAEEAALVGGLVKPASSAKVVQQNLKKGIHSTTAIGGVNKPTGHKRPADDGDTANGIVKDTAMSKWETSSESETENAAPQKQSKVKRRRVDSHGSDKSHHSAHSSDRGRSVTRSRSRTRSRKRSYSSGSSRSSRHSSSRSRSHSHRRRCSGSSRRRSSSYDDSSGSSRSRSRSRRDSRSSSAYSRSSRRSSSRSRSRSSSRHRSSRSRSRSVKRGGLSKRSASENSTRRSTSRSKSTEANASKKGCETTEGSTKLPKKTTAAASKSGSGVDLSSIPAPKEQDIKKISLPSAPEPKGKDASGNFIGPTLPPSHRLFHLDIPMPNNQGQKDAANSGGGSGGRDVFQRIGPNDPLVFKASSESAQPAASSFEIPPDQLDQYRLLQKKAAKHAMQQMRREQGLPVEDDDEEEEEEAFAAEAEGVVDGTEADNLDMLALEQQQQGALTTDGLTEEQLEQLLLQQQQQQQQLQQVLIAPQTQLLAGGQAIQLLGGGGGGMSLQALTSASPANMQLVQMPNGQLVYAATATSQPMATAGGFAFATAGGGQMILASPQQAYQLQQLQAQQNFQLQAQQQAFQLQAAAAAHPQLYATGGLGGMMMLAGGGLAAYGGLSGLTAVRLASGGVGLAATRPTLVQATHSGLQAIHPGLQAFGLAQQPQLISREMLAGGALRLPSGLQFSTQAAGYPVMLGGPRYVLQRLPQGP